jgi:allantoinase
VGQPHRLKHLRRALEVIARARDQGSVWFTTPGQIHEHVAGLTGTFNR